MPSWKRAFVSVIVVTLLTYLTFDFTCYLIMRSMDGVLLQVPPGYSYGYWFREPLGLKWFIVSHAGPVKYLPFVFGLCVAGTTQLVVLEGQANFHWSLLIVALQWVATAIAGYVLSLLFGVALTSIGWTPEQQVVEQGPQQQQAQAQSRKTASPRDTKATSSKVAKAASPKDTTSKRYEPTASGKKDEKTVGGTGSSLTFAQEADGDVKEAKDYLAHAGTNIKAYADAQLEDLKEVAAPVTKHLPEPVQNFLDDGGWWLILGICAFLALLWLRSMLRKLRGVGHGFRRKKKKGKKKRARAAPAIEQIELQLVGEGYTDEGPRRLVVKGMPARLRMVILSMGTKGGQSLSEDMADRILDWIKRGLAEVASYDYPGVRVWPMFPSADGFANALQAHVPIPQAKGAKSNWVLIAGSVQMGRAIIHVGMVLYTEEKSSLRFIKVKDERWLDVLSIEKNPEMIGAV
jgi:hypothetical protein